VPIQTSLTYCHYSLNDTSLMDSGFMQLCRSRNIALINASPISMGLLMDRTPPDWHPANSEQREVCQKAVRYCKAQGVDISKIAVQFSLQNKEIATTLISTANYGRMLKNLEAVTVVLTQKERDCMNYIRSNIFRVAGNQSWEGVEVGAYWKLVGPQLMYDRLYAPSKVKDK